MRIKHLTREFFIPKGSTKITDRQSDAVVYIYNRGKPGAAMFFAKQTKPVWHFTFRTEERRAAKIKETFENRRATLAYKTETRAKRKAWVSDYVVGEILHTSWGYDQTNVEYFEVTEVKGKHVVVREIAQERTATGHMQGHCVPLPGKYLEARHEGDKQGLPLRRLAQERGIKIDEVRTAFRDKPQKIGGVEVHIPRHWTAYA